MGSAGFRKLAREPLSRRRGRCRKEKGKKLRKSRPALLYGTRPASPGALKPANMVDTCFLSQGLTTLAGLLLLPFGSLAASQIEVGVRPSERQGPAGDSCVVAVSVQQMSDTQLRREASWKLTVLWGGCRREQERTVTVCFSLLKWRMKRIKS